MSYSPSHRDVEPVRPLVDDEEMYEAMHFLDTSGHDLAVTQADWEYAEYIVGVAEAVAASFSDESSVDKRKWEARRHKTYSDALVEMRRRRMAFLEVKAKREAATQKIDVWRTIRADQRARSGGGMDDSTVRNLQRALDDLRQDIATLRRDTPDRRPSDRR